MTMTLSGSGTIGGLVAGGLPDATITQPDLATGVAGNGPAFSAYKNAGQSISALTYTKLLFDNEVFDTNNNFDSSRFTPTVAGYYQINAVVNMSGQTTGGLYVSIYKNGVNTAPGAIAAGSSLGIAANVSAVIYMNGSTDYVEAYVYDSGAFTTNPGASTNFNGCLVRAA